MKDVAAQAKKFLAATSAKEEQIVVSECWMQTLEEIIRLSEEAERKKLPYFPTAMAILDGMHAKWQKFALLTKGVHPATFAFLLSSDSEMSEIGLQWMDYRRKIGKPIDLSYFAERKAQLAKLKSPA